MFGMIYMVDPKHEIMSCAADLIRRGWTQGAFARTPIGREVAASDPDAGKWCLCGAVWKASRMINWTPEIHKLANAIRTHTGQKLQDEDDIDVVTDWNDTKGRTLDEVLTLLENL